LDPSPFGSFLGCLTSDPAANGFMTLVRYFGLIGVPPHLQLLEPSPMSANGNGLYFPGHNEGIVTPPP
jgi:hypothetical protein